MAANTVSFLAAAGSSTPITVNIHPKLASSAIHASISQNYPLASKIIVKNLFSCFIIHHSCEHPLELNSMRRPILFKRFLYEHIIKISDLPFSASESRLVKEFSQYGKIAEVKLVKDEARQKSKGFAFIQYTSQEAALLALESMDHQLFDDRQVFVELANLRRSDFGGYPKTSGPPQEQQKVTKDDVDE